MIETQEEKPNLLTSIPGRLSYAWNAPEQRFEWLHLSRRRFFRNLCNMPGELVGWSITNQAKAKKPILPDISGENKYNNAGQLIDSSLLTGILFKQVLDVGAKFGLSAYVKTAVSGYNRNEAYQSLLHTATSLKHMAASAVQTDPDLKEWADELITRDGSALMQLAQHTHQANELMMGFAHGKLLPTEENMAQLQIEMNAIADLCDKKAGVVSDAALPVPDSGHEAAALLKQHAPQAAADIAYANRTRPSDHIREVLVADKITTAKQAVIYLAVMSGLVNDGAMDISSELYTLKGEHYFSAKEAKQVAATVKKFRQEHPSQEPSAQDLIGLANAIKINMRASEKNIAPMLAYADLHFAEVDRSLKPQPQVETLVSVSPSTVQLPKLQTGKPLTSSYYAPKKVGAEYIIRDEAKHEMFKLYSRSLPTYLYQAPINLVERLILPNADGKWRFNKQIVGNELKAASWMALYNPAAESFAGVSTYEATRLDLHQAVESGKRLDAFMAAALQTLQTADPEFSDTLRGLSGNRQYRQLIDEHRNILTKPENEKTPEDYRAIGELVKKLGVKAKAAQQEMHTLLTGSDDTTTIKQHVADIFSHGAKTTADAMLLITLARFIEHTAEGQILSYEYVDHEQVILDNKQLQKLSLELLAAAKEAGIAVAGESLNENGQRSIIGQREGIAAGTLVRREESGAFKTLNKEELIGFANLMIQKMTADKGAAIQKFMTTGQGRLSDQVMREAEQAVLSQFQPPQTAKNQPADSAYEKASLKPITQSHPTHKITFGEAMDYVTRPEALHEMRQLRDRYLAVSLFGFPVKIATNILRGDFNKLSTAFGKWSLASTGFAAFANTFAPSYGAVAMKEAYSAGNIALKHHANNANAHLQQLMGQLGHAEPDMKERLVSSLGINPLLGNKQAIEQLAMASQFDAALNKTATTFINHTASTLAGASLNIFPEGDAKPIEVFSHIMKLPDGNPAYAALKLAALDALIAHETYYLDILRYEGHAARLIGNKQLKGMVNTIEDRFYTEAGSLDKSSAAYVTTIADDLAKHALPLLEQMKELEANEYQPNLQRIKQDITASAATGLSR